MNLVARHACARGGAGRVELPFGEVDAAPLAATPLARRRRRCCSASGRTTWRRPARASTAPRFPATVHLTEPLGDVTVLDLEAGGAVLKMVLPEEQALRLPAGRRARDRAVARGCPSVRPGDRQRRSP